LQNQSRKFSVSNQSLEFVGPAEFVKGNSQTGKVPRDVFLKFKIDVKSQIGIVGISRTLTFWEEIRKYW